MFSKTPVAGDAYDEDAREAIPEDSLRMVRALAQEMKDAERVVAERTAELAAAMARYRDVAEVRLPKMMEENDLPSFTFRDRITGLDRTIEIHSRVDAGISKDAGPEEREGVYDFLERNELGGIIKHDMTVPLGLRPSDQVAAMLLKFRQTFPDFDAAVGRRVEAATLSKAVRGLIERGVALPSAINVHRQHAARVVEEKQAKRRK
jgi:hypothetical protein